MSKKMEYRTLEVEFEELANSLNRAAEEGFKAIQFFEGPDQKIRTILARKVKRAKVYEEMAKDEIY